MKQKSAAWICPIVVRLGFCGAMLVNHAVEIELKMKGRLKVAATP